MADSVARSLNRVPPHRQTGPRKADLLRQYERVTGIPASPRATKAWLGTEIGAAHSRARANRVAAGVQALGLLTAAVGTYRRVRAEQRQNGPGMLGDGVDQMKAVGAAAYAVAPGLALTMLQGTANHASHVFRSLPLGLSFQMPLAHAAAAVTKATGRAVLPVLAGWSMHREAQADGNALRGAGRGLVRAIDPTGIVLGKGLAERGYDAVFGAAPDRTPPEPGFWDSRSDPRFQYQKNGYERFLDGVYGRVGRAVGGLLRSGAFVDARASRHAALPAPVAPPTTVARVAVSYKDSWSDSRGRSYVRHDTSVRTADLQQFTTMRSMANRGRRPSARRRDDGLLV